MIKFPPYLLKGDRIGIVAPAGFMSFEKMESCVNLLQDWGYTVRLGATTHSHSENYFSGTDEERLADLQEMLDDGEVNAILCARGGYGMSRLLDRLSFRKFKKHPKWIVGFSDITALHSHLLACYDIASLHAPMAAAFNEEVVNNPSLQSLQDALEGRPAQYRCNPSPLNRTGEVTAELVGGNLTLLAHLVGSDSDVKTKNRILFLEDIGEYLYNIDRMLLQLKRAGKLSRLAGLVIGGFTDLKDTERPFGTEVKEIIRHHVEEFDFPLCFDFSVSHGKENLALKIGGTYRLSVTEGEVGLTEAGS
jgi:muramoyltetrapeptide carboxypeptidase